MTDEHVVESGTRRERGFSVSIERSIGMAPFHLLVILCVDEAIAMSKERGRLVEARLVACVARHQCRSNVAGWINHFGV